MEKLAGSGYRRLNDGNQLPAVGFGTWPLQNGDVESVVKAGFDAGYRLVDTASRYGNEEGVGRGVRASELPLDQLYVTSKLRGADHGYDEALRAFDASSKRLGLERIALYLIHWPLPAKNRYVETWRAFVRLREEGRVRSIGVSNFEPHHIDRLLEETGIAPAVNQVELHPEFSQPALRSYHDARGIVTQAWRPLGKGESLKSAVVAAIAGKHGKSTAQVILRWHFELGIVAIPKSERAERLRENISIFDFQLDAEDRERLGTIESGRRLGGHPDTHSEE
jgi:2,5-diketo-D-gluconate reductase A